MSAPAPSVSPSPRRLAGELWGGFAAMLVALPSSIAYGVSVYALLGPDYVATGVRAGVIGAIVIGLVAPWLGGAPRLISAPCAPAAAVLAAVTGELLAGARGAAPLAPGQIAVLLTLLAALCGGLQFLYGALGGGRLIKYIPFPVVSGYLSGVGLLIFISQVPNFLGVPKKIAWWVALESPTLWQWPALLVGAVTVAAMLLALRLTRAVPATICGLLAGMAAFLAIAWLHPTLLDSTRNPFVIGPIAGGARALLPPLGALRDAVATLHFDDFKLLVAPALTLSVLLSIDTLKTCVVVDALTRSRHDSNRELRGQGTANFLSALFGGMPGAGMMGATLVNVESGGRTRLSGMLEGAFVLLVFLLLGKLIAWVPLAALAGILVVVAARMFDWNSFHLLRQRSTMLDFAVSAAVIVVALAFNLIAAAGAGVALAILLFIREQIRTSVIRRKISGDKLRSKLRRLPAEEALLDRHGAETTICELQGSLFFGTTDQLFTDLAPDLARCRHVILDLRRVTSVDFSAAHVLEQFAATLAEHDGWLLFSRLPANLPSGRNLDAYFAQLGVTAKQANVRKFATLDDALQWTENRLLAAHGLDRTADDRALALDEIELLREFAADGTLDIIAACAEERSFAEGELIFRAGAPNDELFLVRRGTVRVALPLKDGGHHNLAFFSRGDFFGEIAFLDRGIRSADAFATTPTGLFAISRARFDTACRTNAIVGVKVFARLARALALRLRHADAELRAWYET
ncbi:MAG TPA: SulP family inorganic anion transporter [Opitutaceae bacterium]|nr:SulP family inorganic anion transporter [Opitutaceae bacterium]